MKKISLLSLIIAVEIICSVTIFAGGPLQTLNGKSVRFKSNIITYKIDRGPFGIFTSAQARDLANASFKTWDDVASSTVTFQHSDADTLPVDVNGTNFLSYTNLDSAKIDGINPIVFDSDGSITEAMFGTGASADVIGFAYSEDRNNDGFLDEGEAFMNGVFADGTVNSFSLAEWKSTFVHEFGHFLGLDHTQINGDLVNDPTKTQYIPTMFPTATANDVPLGDLNPDDIAAISALYPEPTFATSTGTISGTVKRGNGSVITGANVIAISTGADSLNNQISTFSGGYSIAGLAPGTYNVRVEPISTDFTGGSGVGPYSYDLTDISFINPIVPEYYNGASESSDPLVDNPSARTPVTVSASSTTSGINFIANAKPAGAPLLIDDFNFSGLLGSNGWGIHSGTTNFLSTTTGLSYTGFPGSGIGNAVLVSNLGGEDVNKGFDEQTGNGTAIYTSFVVNVTDASTSKTGDYFLHIGKRSSPTNFSTIFPGRIFVKIVSGNVNFGVSNTSTATYGTTNYAKNTVYAVVSKYTINTSGNDETKLWVFSSAIPTSEANAGTPLASNTTTVGQDTINAIAIRQGNASNSVQVVIDAININTIWPNGSASVKDISSPLIPASIELMQNYPNPFNPTTSIRFALPSSEFVRLTVFDLLGREVALLAEGKFEAGVHEVRFDAHQLSSGTYFYSLEAGTHREIKKMVLMK
jgi:hypothetical protein